MTENIIEEVFCLQFENKALSELLIHNHAERWVYGYMYAEVEAEHLIRYDFVQQFIEQKNVLDIACGCGYGSYLMGTSGKAKKVVGVDLNSDSVRYGNYRYKTENVTRYVGDATTYQFNEKFDVVVSFETIEHIPDFELFLRNTKQALKVGGKFIVSTPIVNKTTQQPNNPYHVIEWDYNDFHSLMRKYFEVSEVYFQNIALYKDVPQPGLISRILRKITQAAPQERRKKVPLEKDQNQYNLSEIESGFQIFVCNNI